MCATVASSRSSQRIRGSRHDRAGRPKSHAARRLRRCRPRRRPRLRRRLLRLRMLPPRLDAAGVRHRARERARAAAPHRLPHHAAGLRHRVGARHGLARRPLLADPPRPLRRADRLLGQHAAAIRRAASPRAGAAGPVDPRDASRRNMPASAGASSSRPPARAGCRSAAATAAATRAPGFGGPGIGSIPDALGIAGASSADIGVGLGFSSGSVYDGY